MPHIDKMATHSSVLAWKTPRTGEPGGLQSVESRRVDITELPRMHGKLIDVY